MIVTIILETGQRQDFELPHGGDIYIEDLTNGEVLVEVCDELSHTVTEMVIDTKAIL